MSGDMLWITFGLGALNLVALGVWVASFRPRFVIGAQLVSTVEPAEMPVGAETDEAPEDDEATEGHARLEDWIDEIEQSGSRAAAPAEGSEAWWRAWADSGGSLPSAADSGRAETTPATKRLSSVG